jgi:hypothetical protein
LDRGRGRIFCTHVTDRVTKRCRPHPLARGTSSSGSRRGIEVVCQRGPGGRVQAIVHDRYIEHQDFIHLTNREMNGIHAKPGTEGEQSPHTVATTVGIDRYVLPLK